MTLAEYIQTQLLETGGSDAGDRFEAAEFVTFLKRARSRDRNDVADLIAIDSDTAELAEDSLLVTFTLADPFGDQTVYIHNNEYHLLTENLTITVDDVVIADTDWTYDELVMELTFDVPRPEATPVVTIAGLIVNLDYAMVLALQSLLHKLASAGSVRGKEFEQHYNRVKRLLDERYGHIAVRSSHGT